jgi:hypothetical protein
MDKGIESGLPIELGDHGNDEQLTIDQEMFIQQILAKVDKGIKNGDEIVSHNEIVGNDDPEKETVINSVLAAMLVIKRAYNNNNVFPTNFGYYHKETVEGVTEQGLFIDIQLQPDDSEISE